METTQKKLTQSASHRKLRMRAFAAIICFILAILFVIMPLATIILYENIFGTRYETAPWLAFDIADYPQLQMQRSDFCSDGVMLAGYQYAKENTDAHGVIIVSHGLGGGGHNSYMPVIDYFTSNGYYVFAYDARGNDSSGGDSVEGLPQGVIDLDNAINHVETLVKYQDLPIVLFGHSWGAYSAGNVLNMHPEVEAAVLVAGFNESDDLILYQGEQMIGGIARLLVPYVDIYEHFKFGKAYTSVSALEGMLNSPAGVMVVHSSDDTTVPMEYGYDTFYEAFGSSDRFEFIAYEDRGHDYLIYSEKAKEYRKQLNADYVKYVESHGGEYNGEIKAEFMNKNLDKKQCFEPDPELMTEILNFYHRYCE